jgi:hypothetical protein
MREQSLHDRNDPIFGRITVVIRHDAAILNLEIKPAVNAPTAVIRVMEKETEARHPIVCN